MTKENKKKKPGIRIILTSIVGIIWTFSFIFIGTMMFMSDNLAEKLFLKTGKIPSTHFTGGEIIESLTEDDFIIQSHEMIREGFRKRGRRVSVQIDWKYRNGETPVKDFLITYPEYDQPLGRISIQPETEEIAFEPLHPDVLGLMNIPTMGGWGYLVSKGGKHALLKYDDGVSVRIVLRKRD